MSSTPVDLKEGMLVEVGHLIGVVFHVREEGFDLWEFESQSLIPVMESAQNDRSSVRLLEHLPMWVTQVQIDSLCKFLQRNPVSLGSPLGNLIFDEYRFLTRQILVTTPYRVGRTFPGKKSIEGIALVMVLRQALQVTKVLAEKDIDMSALLSDIQALHKALERAEVRLIDEEKI